MVLVSDKLINTIVLTSLIVLIIHFLHAGRQRDTLPGTEEPMITIEFITALFYQYFGHFLSERGEYTRLCIG